MSFSASIVAILLFSLFFYIIMFFLFKSLFSGLEQNIASTKDALHSEVRSRVFRTNALLDMVDANEEKLNKIVAIVEKNEKSILVNEGTIDCMLNQPTPEEVLEELGDPSNES